MAILITVGIQGLFSGFVTIGRYGKWYQPTALHDAAVQAISGIGIVTMRSIRHRTMRDNHDRRALAEVCTVPMLLVYCVLFILSVCVSLR